MASTDIHQVAAAADDLGIGKEATTAGDEQPPEVAAVPASVDVVVAEKPALDVGADSVSAPTDSDDKPLLEAAFKEEAAVELGKAESEGEVTEDLPQQEERQIPTSEPTAELPVADKKEPQQLVPGPVDEHSETAVAVPSKDDEMVDQIAPALESAVVVPTPKENEADVEEASTETVVPDAEKAVAVEIKTAAEGLPECEAEKIEEEGVEETIANPQEPVSGGAENGTNEVEEKLKDESVQEEGIKQVAGEDVKAEQVTEESVEKLEELVSSGTENGTNEVEEKLKDESVLEEEAEVAKAEEVKTESPEELVSNITENGTDVVEKELKDESLLEEEAKDVKAEEVTEVETENPEELVSKDGTDVVEKELEDENLLEKEAKDVKAEEVTEVKTVNPEELVSKGTENGTDVVEKELKDGSLLEDVKAEEVAQTVTVNAGDAILDKDVADEQNLGAAKEETNESESVEGEAAAKPNDSSALEPPKADDNRDLPVTEVITKSTPKSSGNIISKVKQSLVKVKKAITGKSPASKTAS